jgi:hypothetical protein
MAVVYSGTVTVGNYNNATYGYSNSFLVYGSISDSTPDMYSGSSTILMVQTNQSPSFQLTLNFTGDVTGGWETFTINGTTFNYSDFTRTYSSYFSITAFVAYHTSFILPTSGTFNFSFNDSASASVSLTILYNGSDATTGGAQRIRSGYWETTGGTRSHICGWNVGQAGLVHKWYRGATLLKTLTVSTSGTQQLAIADSSATNGTDVQYTLKIFDGTTEVGSVNYNVIYCVAPDSSVVAVSADLNVSPGVTDHIVELNGELTIPTAYRVTLASVDDNGTLGDDTVAAVVNTLGYDIGYNRSSGSDGATTPYSATNNNVQISGPDLPGTTAGDTKDYRIWSYRYRLKPDGTENFGENKFYDFDRTFTLTRAAPATTISNFNPTFSTYTEGSGSGVVIFTFDIANSTQSTYYWRIKRVSGQEEGEFSSPGLSGTVTNVTTSGQFQTQISNNFVDETGYQGETFFVRLSKDSGESQPLGDSGQFTVFDNDLQFAIGTISPSTTVPYAFTSPVTVQVTNNGQAGLQPNSRIYNTNLNVSAYDIGDLPNPGNSETYTLDSDAFPPPKETHTYELQVWNGNELLSGPTFTLTRGPVLPDKSITLQSNTLEVIPTDTNHTIVIQETSPDENSAVTEYRVRSGSSVFESRTGPGSITVSDVPTVVGFPKYYIIEARVPDASGGTGFYEYTSVSYSVTLIEPQTSNPPTINDYGIAIYDHNGVPITSFTAGHSLLREVFTTQVTLSSTSTTVVNTGLSGSFTFASLGASVTGEDVNGAQTSISVPVRVSTSNGQFTIILGRHPDNLVAKVSLLQYRGRTLTATNTKDYGIEILNRAGGVTPIVLDDDSLPYTVSSIINCAGYSTVSGDYAKFITIPLPGTYTRMPLVGIACSNKNLLVPPHVYRNGTSYSAVITIPKSSSASTYTIAVLSTENRTYYGGTASINALSILNNSGQPLWRSDMRQAILNEARGSDIFTLGVSTSEVTLGYDGVVKPNSSGTSTNLANLQTTNQTLTLMANGNEMDPINTYLLSSTTGGLVEYYAGDLTTSDGRVEQNVGGGVHILAALIDSENSAKITMWKYKDGSAPPNSSLRCTRNPASRHPDGSLFFVRIV